MLSNIFIAFDPAMDIIYSNGLFAKGFADDCATLLGGTDLNDLTTRRYETINKLVTWGATCYPCLNSSKIILLLIKNNCKINRIEPAIEMSGQTLS